MTNRMNLFGKTKDKDYETILKELYRIKQYEDERPVQLIEKLIKDNPDFVSDYVAYHGYFSKTLDNREDLFSTYKGPASFSKSLERCIRFVSLQDDTGVLCRGIVRQTGKFFNLDAFILHCLHKCNDMYLEDEFSTLLGELELFAYLDNYEVLDYEEVLTYVGNSDYVKAIFNFSKGMPLTIEELELIKTILVRLVQGTLDNSIKRAMLENFRRRTRFWEVRKVYTDREPIAKEVVNLSVEPLDSSKISYEGEVFLISKCMETIRNAKIYPQLETILDELCRQNICWAIAEDMEYFGYIHIT